MTNWGTLVGKASARRSVSYNCTYSVFISADIIMIFLVVFFSILVIMG